MPGLGVLNRNAWMDFEGFGFYRAHFNLVKPWGIGTAIVLLIQLWALIAGLWWWHGCQTMWKAPERGFMSGSGGYELERRDMNWEWLRE